jgi:hypothetical protein
MIRAACSINGSLNPFNLLLHARLQRCVASAAPNVKPAPFDPPIKFLPVNRPKTERLERLTCMGHSVLPTARFPQGRNAV